MREAFYKYNVIAWTKTDHYQPEENRIMRNRLFDEYTKLRDKWLYAIGYLKQDPTRTWQ